MNAQHQEKIFQAMALPGFYPQPVKTVAQRETHISRVFLTGTHAYKIKKTVNLGFLDFTTLEKRKHFCHQEVMLNRRLAQNIYEKVVSITLKDGHYFLEGEGTPVEYAIRMRQLPDENSMLSLLRTSGVDKKSVADLARVLAEFYSRADTNDKINTFGAWETIQGTCEGNFRLAERFAGTLMDERIFQIIRAATRAFLRRRKPLFQHRIEQGKIRDCHGDLKTEHIYFTGDGIQIIDCIEFNEVFRYLDITSDLAFLAMDFDYENASQLGQDLLNTYVEHTKDQDVFVLLDFYKCYRAFVRCKVNCFRIDQMAQGNLDEQERNQLLRDTEKYLDLAYQYAGRFTRPTLWIVCGMPASGKSTISDALADTLEIKVFHSDVVRKELFDLYPHDPLNVPFEKGIYSKCATSLTYGKLLLLAQDELEKGNSVILDATYSSQHRRLEALRLANVEDTNIIFVECVTADDILKSRLIERETTFSISDARLHHFDQFKSRFEPLDDISDNIHVRIDTDKPVNEGMKKILSFNG